MCSSDLFNGLVGSSTQYGVSFFGQEAITEYAAAFGLSPNFTTAVPLENFGGAGTANSHWRESIFGDELMVGHLRPHMPLSTITVGSIADLHYVVDYGSADSFVPPASPLGQSPNVQLDPEPAPPEFSSSPGFFADFGTETSPLARGFTRVTALTEYNAIRGFGWLNNSGPSIQSVDMPGRVATDLNRDFVVFQDATIAVDLPNGIYDVSVGLGDPARSHDRVQIFVEGDLRGDVSTNAGDFEVQTYRVWVADNQLTLRLASGADAALSSLHVSEVELGDFGGTELRNGRFAFLIQNLDNGSIMRGMRDTTALGGSLCIDGVTLSPGAHYRQWVLDIESLETGVSDFITPPTGQTFELPQIVIHPSFDVDRDVDGLNRTAEFVLGTRDDLADTDSDGISDIAEVRQGRDPLGGRSLRTGVVSTLSLLGESKSVSLEGSITSAETQTAYIATGAYGLAIVDASNFQKPTILSQTDLTGDAVDVAVDSRLGIAVVASTTTLHFADVSDLTSPKLIRSLNVPATQVEIADGIAYVAAGSGVETYSVQTGELIQVLSLGSAPITGLARDGATLYAIDSLSTLRVIEIGGFEMRVLGSLGLPAGTGKLTVGNGIAYVGAGDGQVGGFLTVNVANPASMSVISGVDAQNVQGQAIAVNGSGLAVTVGKFRGFGGGAIRQVNVLDVRDPNKTAAFVTSFNLPADPTSVAIGAGIAFVTDVAGNLHVVNYESFDNRGVAPTAAITALNVVDLDPTTDGKQVQEGAIIPIEIDRKSTRLNSSHVVTSRMPSSA